MSFGDINWSEIVLDTLQGPEDESDRDSTQDYWSPSAASSHICP